MVRSELSIIFEDVQERWWGGGARIGILVGRFLVDVLEEVFFVESRLGCLSVHGVYGLK